MVETGLRSGGGRQMPIGLRMRMTSSAMRMARVVHVISTVLVDCHRGLKRIRLRCWE
jgi:hypothetical protein